MSEGGARGEVYFARETLRADAARLYGAEGCDLYAAGAVGAGRAGLLGPNLAEIVATLQRRGSAIREPVGKRLVVLACERYDAPGGPGDEVFVGVKGPGGRLVGEMQPAGALVKSALRRRSAAGVADVVLIEELIATVTRIASSHAPVLDRCPSAGRGAGGVHGGANGRP